MLLLLKPSSNTSQGAGYTFKDSPSAITDKVVFMVVMVVTVVGGGGVDS